MKSVAIKAMVESIKFMKTELCVNVGNKGTAWSILQKCGEGPLQPEARFRVKG